MRTKFHVLKSNILKLEDWQLDKDEKNELTKLVDELYEEYVEHHKKSNSKGDYGLKFYTIHDDSKYYDEHKVFFKTKEERDQVYEDWGKGLYWDDMFNDNLIYPTPGMNYNHSKTVKTNKLLIDVEE